ncbi:site-specific DNA-methyltransferase [Burkholderia cenocepacia]|uniref:site-specific DNA-methyltransferase n=1 Tax=Burkholderia cenocepacia TaxID=95486 RepID=UPI001B9E9794|nr:site-specific DNA-methyltransferase [Burkholderia cenocepacia]MBR8369767.1 site-specific DNA-methyltransferase [Burkholderia cenocepacia]MBR8440697.1 site-specific DNA-methyltransferase [Burkholderia cenocepacia]
MTKNYQSINDMLDSLTPQEMKRMLVEKLTNQRLGLVWENSSIQRDKALNDAVILPAIVPELSVASDQSGYRHLIIEGDNFDSLRLLRSTHANKIRVIYIDPPYNTGNKDWVYNDRYVGEKDRWRHSQWLEFLYQRLLLARDLLTPDGVILISIDDDNRSRLDMLMEEILPGGRIGSFVWRVRSGGNDTKGAMLSINHEHVLVYGKEGFEFKGDGRDESSYANPDSDPRGDWANDNLVKAHNARQRPEAYYPIRNPETDVWYPCDPDSVWRFSSITRPLKKKLQADPIETIIQERRILWPANENVACYTSIQELERAIKDGSAPKQLKIYLQLKELENISKTDAKVARLLTYIEPLDAWVNRKIGYGKPRYKWFRQQLKRDVTPVSSWLNPAADGTLDDEDDAEITLTVGATGEGTTLYKKILGNKDFPYPKPFSLLMGLLDQATKPGDIVLDFFAGSATTAHAVLALNAQDGGTRQFIMCSSTEATSTDPGRNVCRDVCAERIRRILADKSYGLDGDFAYLRMDKLDPVDARLDATPNGIFQLLSLRNTHLAQDVPDSPVKVIAAEPDVAIVYIEEVSPEVIDSLKTLPQPKLVIYSDRPQSVSEQLEFSGKEGLSFSVGDAIVLGQVTAGVSA